MSAGEDVRDGERTGGPSSAPQHPFAVDADQADPDQGPPEQVPAEQVPPEQVPVEQVPVEQVPPEQDPADRAAADLRLSVMRLTRRLRAERPDRQLTLTQLSVLSRLEREGPSTARELASAERVAPQSVARVVTELAGAQLLDRTPDPRDGRQVQLRITGRGSELLAEDRRGREAWLAGAMRRRLTGSEQQLLAVAARLVDQLVED